MGTTSVIWLGSSLPRLAGQLTALPKLAEFRGRANEETDQG